MNFKTFVDNDFKLFINHGCIILFFDILCLEIFKIKQSSFVFQYLLLF